jgi:hypothetical protein
VSFSEGSAVLDEVAALVRRYIVLSDEQVVVVTLWIVHTYVVDALGITPYLSITSAEKESGKTSLLELLARLVARPWLTGSITAATLARKIERDRPTLLLDETDTAFGGDKDYAETLRGVLNSGFRASGFYSRCVGSTHEVHDFPTFCAKAIAGIGRLPDTAESRSIPIRLKKKSPSERVERKRERVVIAETEPLRARINGWAETIDEPLARFELAALEELPDRAMDIWEPLLGIARLAGDQWFGRATKAAVALSGRGVVEDESLGVRLLADIKAVFVAKDAEHIFSAAMVEALLEFEESPWADWHGRPISKHALARLLKRYDIRPRKVRIGDLVANGYRREDFEDTWGRYLAPQPPTATGTTGTTARLSQSPANSLRNTNNAVPVPVGAAHPHDDGVVPVVPIELGGAAPTLPFSDVAISQDEIERLAELASRYQYEDRDGCVTDA